MAHAVRQTKQDKQWQAESDLRTLNESKEIQGSKVRLNAAKKVAQKQIAALKSIAKTK